MGSGLPGQTWIVSCEVLHTLLTELPRQSCAHQLVMILCPCLDQVTLEYMNSLLTWHVTFPFSSIREAWLLGNL